jgi:hypothetical protein
MSNALRILKIAAEFATAGIERHQLAERRKTSL